MATFVGYVLTPFTIPFAQMVDDIFMLSAQLDSLVIELLVELQPGIVICYLGIGDLYGLFICDDQSVVVENNSTPWTRGYNKGDEIIIPIKNGEGSFQASDETLKELEDEGRIVLRYSGKNPNGSRNNIAGISNKRGNVVGVMPHPEQAIETLTGPSDDGLKFFTSILTEMVSR